MYTYASDQTTNIHDHCVSLFPKKRDVSYAIVVPYDDDVLKYAFTKESFFSGKKEGKNQSQIGFDHAAAWQWFIVMVTGFYVAMRCIDNIIYV